MLVYICIFETRSDVNLSERLHDVIDICSLAVLGNSNTVESASSYFSITLPYYSLVLGVTQFR